MPSPASAERANPASKMPSRRPRSCAANGTSVKRISTPGSSARQSANSAARRGCAAPSDKAMRSCPQHPAPTALALSFACSKTANMRRTSCRKTCPAWVSDVPRGSRLNSCTPSLSSSSLMIRDSGDCSICSRSAALPKCNSSESTTKQRRWRSSIRLISTALLCELHHCSHQGGHSPSANIAF